MYDLLSTRCLDIMADRKSLSLKSVVYAEDFTNLGTEPQLRRQAMRKSIMHVGMDVHKDSIEIAIAEDGGNQEVRR